MNDVVVIPRTSTTAIVSLIFGILSWVICGHVARGEIARSGGTLDGKGVALAGLLLGWLHVAVWAFVFLFLMSLPFGLFGLAHGLWQFFLQHVGQAGCDNSTFHL
jgi:hypothetical protein